MRHLTIVRHAKAEDHAAYDDDFDRPLTERGVRDAQNVGRVLDRLQPPIERWIASPALRALQTATILRDESDGKGEIIFVTEAYLASSDALLAVVRAVPGEVSHVALVAHNPGLEELIAGLTAGDARHFNFRLPTAAFAQIELDVARWDQARWGCGELRTLATPKLFR